MNTTTTFPIKFDEKTWNNQADFQKETECNNSVKTQYPLALVLKRKIVCKCPYRLVFIVN